MTATVGSPTAAVCGEGFWCNCNRYTSNEVISGQIARGVATNVLNDTLLLAFLDRPSVIVSSSSCSLKTRLNSAAGQLAGADEKLGLQPKRRC